MTGVVLWGRDGKVSVAAGAVAWCISLLLALPTAHQRYLSSEGAARQRLQWLGCGAALAGEVAVVVGGLWVFIGWPEGAGAIAAAGTGLIPLAAIASTMPRIAGRVDRVLVHTVSTVGLSVVVIAILGTAQP